MSSFRLAWEIQWRSLYFFIFLIFFFSAAASSVFDLRGTFYKIYYFEIHFVPIREEHLGSQFMPDEMFLVLCTRIQLTFIATIYDADPCICVAFQTKQMCKRSLLLLGGEMSILFNRDSLPFCHASKNRLKGEKQIFNIIKSVMVRYLWNFYVLLLQSYWIVRSCF